MVETETIVRVRCSLPGCTRSAKSVFRDQGDQRLMVERVIKENQWAYRHEDGEEFYFCDRHTGAVCVKLWKMPDGPVGPSPR